MTKSPWYSTVAFTAIAALVTVPEAQAEPGEPQDDPPAVEVPDPDNTDPTPLRRGAPDGFVEMNVLTVAPTEAGSVVILTDRFETVLVPIWIGESEALSIALRLEGEGFRRPLTHDLFDALLREVGAELVEVRIDSLQANTFVASLFIRHDGRDILLDSRASDSIALALGSRVPIYVSERVVEEAGMRPSELGIPPSHPGGHSPTDEQPSGGQIPL